MSAVLAPGPEAILRACADGRFVPRFRNRPIGEETVRAEAGADGRLLLRAETRIAMRRFNLRQTVIAAFAPDLRPEWCTLEAALDSGRVALEAEIGRNGAVTRHRSAGREREGRVEFDRPPLLLLDNCFASHALAALGARRHPQAAAIFVSLPAFEDLPVTRPGVLRVLLGGRAYAPPTLTLHLTPDLDEHVWMSGDWVERLIIPQTLMSVEWSTSFPQRGGPP